MTQVQSPVALDRLMREAETHFVAKRYADALRLTERILQNVPGHPAVLHLRGLVLSNMGELAAARRSLEAARRGLPRDPQIANNLGNLLSKIGESEAALAAYDAAIAADSRFGPARLHRAMMLDELGRYDEARDELVALGRIQAPTANSLLVAASLERNSGNLRAAGEKLDEILASDPMHRVAGHGRARIATELGEPDAGERYRRALLAHPEDPELLIGYIAAAESEEARRDVLERVKTLLSADPGWREGHRALSTALWEQGERQAFAATYESAIALRPHDAGLWKDYVEALGKADEFAAAANVCVRAQAAIGDLAFAVGAFGFFSASGDLEEAETLLARLPADLLRPVAVAKHRLRQRDPSAAEPLLAIATTDDPDDIEAWALRGIAWKLLDDPRFDWLNGQDGLVVDVQLPISEAEISSIAARLRELHAHSTTCIGQSLRGGTQTAGNLFDRLGHEIALLQTSLHEAIERYRGLLPPSDQSHPVLKHRDSQLAFAGSWSIRLTKGGFHVQHMHPKGILSAASYWAVPPPSVEDPQAGWLEIGGSPAYLGLDMRPLRAIEPKVGGLVLFPSTLHHGTRPFPAGERISVAFDVVAK